MAARLTKSRRKPQTIFGGDIAERGRFRSAKERKNYGKVLFEKTKQQAFKKVHSPFPERRFSAIAEEQGDKAWLKAKNF